MSIFQDTVFASIVRAVLGPTYFAHIDEMDVPPVYQKTVHFPKSSATTTTLDDPFNVHTRDHPVYNKQAAGAGDSGDLELSGELPKPVKEPIKAEGSDSLLVTWYGPDDPEVCQGCHSCSHQIDLFCKESNELVANQENMGHFSNVLSDLLRLLWCGSLYCWGKRRLGAISCQLRFRNSWAYSIPAREWNW
jgi:hypothetical protein